MSKMIRVQSLAAFASFLLAGCTMAKSTVVSLSMGEVEASARLGRVSMNSATQFRYVHAQLIVEDKVRKLKSINLNCFTLTIGGVTSDGVSVDSITTFLQERYQADANGHVQVPVYWYFPAGSLGDRPSLSVAKLGTQGNSLACFHY